MLTGGWIFHKIACLEGSELGLRRGHSSVGRAPALQAGGRRFDPVWLHQTAAYQTPACGRSTNVQNERKSISSAALRSGFLDIVKKGYARDAGPPVRVISGHWFAQRCACTASRQADVVGSSSLNRRLRLGLSRCNWSFYRRCSPCREGAGKEFAPPKREGSVRLSQVSIANESDQVS
jgi:hypothetical protein